MMFGFRTPTKTTKASNEDPQGTMTASQTTEEVGPTQKEGERSQTSNVRRSIGEWESGKPDKHSKTTTTTKKGVPVELPKPKQKVALSQESRVDTRRKSVEVVGSPPKPEKQKQKYSDRLSEARACVTKAKLNLGNSRNIKTEIKTEVIIAIERLYQLVKEAESIKGQDKNQYNEQEKEKEPEREKEKDSEIIRRIEEHAKLIQENNVRMEKLQETIEKNQEVQERQTYSSVAAAFSSRQAPEQTALHSVVVSAKDETETGEEVLNRIRKVVNAREGGVVVERIRKAKDGKIIVGCKTELERERIKERLKKAGEHLNFEDMKNKDPLVILRDVLQYNSDEDVLSALRNQNKDLLSGKDGKDQNIEVIFKKRTRNPHTHHIVMRVSPTIWKLMVEAGSVMIDLQRVRVADHSPLVQCSLCLGYGHGRRFCKETIEKCSHCGGPHIKSDCADWLAGTAPSCCNCTHAKMDKTDHNAFSQECKIRRKWEALARATIAYC